MGIPGIAIKLSTDLESALQKLHLAKTLKTEAEKLESEAKTLLMPLLKTGDHTYTSTQGCGTASYVKPGVSKSFDKEKAAQALLAKGVPAQVIHDAYDCATSIGTRAAYIKYDAPK